MKPTKPAVKSSKPAVKSTKTAPSAAVAEADASVAAIASEVAPAVAEEEAAVAEEEAAVAEAEAAVGVGSQAPAESGTQVLLQDWTPLGQSLDLRIGQVYWAGHAHELFADQQVPHLAHDSGALSQRAARVLFAWCQEQAALGTLPQSIVLVEAGMGTGLHLRFLLDAFRDRCVAAGAPFYDRLTAYGTDVSPATVRRAVERGLFVGHAGHIRLGYLDATQPGWFGELDTGTAVDLRGKIHGFIANYLLDLMPMDVFRRTTAVPGGPTLPGNQPTLWEAVLVRTWLREPERISAYSDRTLEEIQALAEVAGAADEQGDAACAQLADVFSLLQLEMRAWPVDLRGHPDLGELERAANAQEAALGKGHDLLQQGTIVNHSAGALRVAQLIGLALADNGYASLRDVGFCTPELAAVPRNYQKYGPTAAAGVNIVQMDGFFAAGQAPERLQFHAPRHDGVRNQAARLLTKSTLAATRAEFDIAYDGEDMARAGELADEARAEANPMIAMEKFRQAVVLEPTNWHLMAEAARTALANARRPDVAMAIAAKGLELNTEYSPDLWNVFGDAHYAVGNKAAALHAYEQGLIVQPHDVRLRFSAASVEAARGRYAAAFRHLGEALASDRQGTWRGEVLQLLDACLRGQQAHVRAEDARLADRDQR